MVVTQIGEGFAGSARNAAHVNTVLGGRGGAVESAWTTALATPRLGHVPFVAVVRPGLAVKPLTLFVNKAALHDERHERLTWGAAQAAVAAAVCRAVTDGIVPAETVDDLLLIAAVWVARDADEADAVYRNNLDATFVALQRGATGAPRVDDVLAEATRPWNPFFDGPGRSSEDT